MASNTDHGNNALDWKESGLTIIIIGASGDLAKKKTYPSLFDLYNDSFLPPNTTIWGYARSNMTREKLRSQLTPFLMKRSYADAQRIDEFLSHCYYQKGASYGDAAAFKEMSDKIREFEDKFPGKKHNRLFYFAIPPNVFAETGAAIREAAMADRGWSRMIVEKPFGMDLDSCQELLKSLSDNFEEKDLYRIDHYLGKEMVQNLLVLRFSNIWFEQIWNRNNVHCVFLTFKEPFGTQGRGGYYDKFGIIRDIIQNHLMQVLTLLAMEPPVKVDSPEASDQIRDAKVAVLKSIQPITLDECYLGQYEGYTDDPTITNKQSNTPTFAVVRCFVRTPRLDGIPFIIKAGKCLDERKAEIRIQFKSAPAADFMFDDKCPRNELVIRMQPAEAIYMKTNVKAPGFSSHPIQSELEVNYDSRFFEEAEIKEKSNPDAYTRLILDVIRGRQAAFVRADELIESWKIFTPLLHKIEEDNVKPVKYECGIRGPPCADHWIREKSGYVRDEDYQFYYMNKTSEKE